MKYTGERLVPGVDKLKALLTEDLAKFVFASQYLQGKYVLDAGCGAGQGANYVAANAARAVVAVDIDPEAVGFAQGYFQRDNLKFSVMSVERLSFPDNTFEAVTSIEVIEHLYHHDWYLAGIARVLKPEGIYILSTPNKRRTSPTPGGMWPAHTREFYIHELRDMLSQHFSKIEIWGESIPLYEHHPLRKVVRYLAPLFKPILPRRLRTSALPTVHRLIKEDLAIDDVLISQSDIEEAPTVIAVCRK